MSADLTRFGLTYCVSYRNEYAETVSKVRLRASICQWWPLVTVMTLLVRCYGHRILFRYIFPVGNSVDVASVAVPASRLALLLDVSSFLPLKKQLTLLLLLQSICQHVRYLVEHLESPPWHFRIFANIILTIVKPKRLNVMPPLTFTIDNSVRSDEYCFCLRTSMCMSRIAAVFFSFCRNILTQMRSRPALFTF